MKLNLKGSLMVQGTTSDAGKSILVAGLCRVLKRKGVSVAPFKPQNMALNSAVTAQGGEIGRAQALQAIACGLELHTDFNPVLLKPCSNMKSQVIIHGKAVSSLDAAKFGNIKALAFQQVLESYARLQKQYDVIVIEGAGSPAEVNLRENDIANMGFAEEVDCPVILISDIDRGGVFAHLTGTLNILSKSEQARIKGFIINKFRGSLDLLQNGLDWLESKTNKKVLGVLPYLQDLKLDAEDAITHQPAKIIDHSKINIVVIILPRTSNHTDFEPLQANPNVNLIYIRDVQEFRGAELIIIPGSKSVRDDLSWLKSSKWKITVDRHLRYGGKLLGICGGFQMLGNCIVDSIGVEGTIGKTNGLALLDFETELTASKDLKQVSGAFEIESENKILKGNINGYEIHCGLSKGKALDSPFCSLTDQNGNVYSDGAVSKDLQVIGTYCHGIFENKETTQALLSWISDRAVSAVDWNEIRESELERLADMLEEHLDMEQVFDAIQ
jgi:adenosylcobyric acid synthase